MAIPAPPRITRAEITPGDFVTGTELSVAVEWTGHPRAQPQFQWRDGSAPIPGATGGSYTAPSPAFDANCVIRIDNGRGTAQAVALPVPITTPDPGPGEVESFVFEAGVFEAGVFE